jgi:phenylpyruvate tautomerase PptA (4-oxalocrotonate tautomerase family)
MPVLFIEVPPGIGTEAKRKMVQKLTEAVDEMVASSRKIPKFSRPSRR